MVAIDGLNLVRRNRKEIMHGGVCMYIKDTVPFSVLEDLADDFFEVLWLDLRPSRLPRGVNNIFVGVIYHPPKAQNSEMLAYLIKCLSAIESRYSNCGIILLGDVNKLDTTRLKSNYNLKQIVHFPHARTKHPRPDSDKSITMTQQLNGQPLVFQTIAQSQFNLRNVIEILRTKLL